ncbi:butyrate kinase [Desulfonatronum thiosulfatophilum]|uniref:Probable butyrate kinase n=1 Tax=Desulfonatronum thiosulfatophilum TaxID=617002 RepID=A0A1G6BJ49_9BACT|nr:butyrate kinase [Desulfonatronum thiosulfatophilum]SDB20671.1 butyrate kinase [Desulfonatronum thiosulfatophilum]
MQHAILTINPGSTSTKVVLFQDGKPILSRDEQHPKMQLAAFADVWSQYAMRLDTVLKALAESAFGDLRLDAVVGRGGLLAPLPGGVYDINEQMIDDLRNQRYGEHPCNLGAPLALELASRFGGRALVVDPVVTDELSAEARPTGLPQVHRRSAFHALSQRGAAREAARRRGLKYEAGKFIVAHLGGGISIGAHLRGRVVEVTNALDGEGPMTPERTGALPVMEVLRLLENGDYDVPGLRRAVLRGGGILAHLGTNDFRVVESRIREGDRHAQDVFHAFAYNIARHATSLLPALITSTDPLPVDALVITGGLAKSTVLVAELAARLSPIMPIETILGMTEAHVMASSASDALQGTIQIQVYQG